MTEKQPVLLTILIETGARRWFVAGITEQGESFPLLCSETGNLDPYLGLELDDQVSFLRHRFTGVLQRGYDRLWARSMKPSQIVFIADAEFEQADPKLYDQLAQHLVQWMTNPPLIFFASENGFSKIETPRLQQIAGEMQQIHREVLEAGVLQLTSAMTDSDRWELSPSRPHQ